MTTAITIDFGLWPSLSFFISSMGTVAHTVGVDNILKDPSMNIPKAMPEVLWEVGYTDGQGKKQMHIDTSCSYYRLRFTLASQTLVPWGGFGGLCCVFEVAALSLGNSDSCTQGEGALASATQSSEPGMGPQYVFC